MLLGALIDTGADPDLLITQLKQLPLDGYKIEIHKVLKNHVSAVKVDITVTDDQPERHLADMLALLDKAAFSGWVTAKAREVFGLLARTEAKIHGTTPEKIHFHEVGAVDSIIDITGTLLALEQLGAKGFFCSPLPMNRGFVRCAHGLMPLPAPAVLELMKDVPTVPCDIEKEMVTPTGIALMKTLVQDFIYPPDFILRGTGYGAGTRDLPIPNVLRILTGYRSAAVTRPDHSSDEVIVLECNIDDLDPRIYQTLLRRLLDAGALDVFLTQGIMKKSRPAVQLQVIADDACFRRVSDIIFRETTTLGLRMRRESRLKLERSFVNVQTPFGEVRMKLAYYGDDPQQILNAVPEYEDCLALAEQHNVPLKTVMRAAVSAYKPER